MHYTIKELPMDERPYEKYLKYGPKSLSDAELLAVIIKSGTKSLSSIEVARKVLSKQDGTLNISSICRKSFNELVDIPGIGSVKAITLKCIAEISERISNSKYVTGYTFDKPSDVAACYMERLRHLDYEKFLVLFLDSSKSFLKDIELSKGSVRETVVPVREVFINALKYGAVKMILLHNHPSGNPSPSNQDINITKDIINAGHLIGIDVLDHIIIGDNNYVSFKECKILFEE